MASGQSEIRRAFAALAQQRFPGMKLSDEYSYNAKSDQYAVQCAFGHIPVVMHVTGEAVRTAIAAGKPKRKKRTRLAAKEGR